MTTPAKQDAAERAVQFMQRFSAIVRQRGATLNLGFKGRYSYLQAQWLGEQEALSLLRVENRQTLHYLTEDKETDDVEPSERRRRLTAERVDLAMTCAEMRLELDALVREFDAGLRLTSDGKRAWVQVRIGAAWVPVIRCRKGQPPEMFDAHAAAIAKRPDVAAIARGVRHCLPPMAMAGDA